jgi:hypothetical protein
MNANVSSESEHLPIHVAKCEERYKTLELRIGRLEVALYRVAAALITGIMTILVKLFLLALEIH